MYFTSIKPMLVSMGKEVSEDEGVINDIKWDGWRILIHKKEDRVEGYTRHGNQITNQFPELKEVGQHIHATSAILDCEGVVLRNGISVFDDFAYRGRLKNQSKIEEARHTHPATFVAFDVLSINDESWIHQPLIKRKEALQSLIEPSSVLVTSPYRMGAGKELFEFTRERGMEGIVSKNLNSKYQIDKRSPDWTKHKHFKLTNCVIIGVMEGPFRLIVGQYFKDGKLKAVATVECGFKPEEKVAFRQVVNSLIQYEKKGVWWIEPVLCCVIQYLERTALHHLRIVSFKGFLPNHVPGNCVWGNEGTKL